jgi:hypothetical protein
MAEVQCFAINAGPLYPQGQRQMNCIVINVKLKQITNENNNRKLRQKI